MRISGSYTFKKLLSSPILIGLMAILFSVSTLKAQEITFTTRVNKAVAAGERFEVSFLLTNVGAKIAPPEMTGLNVIFGPSVSKSASNYNGKYSSTIIVSYVVVAEKEGKITIGRAKAYTDKGVLETDPVIVTVGKNPYAGGNQNPAQAQDQPNPSSQKGEIILTVVPSKTKAYVGEAIPVTYYLYSRYQRLDLGKYDFPAITGFWCEDLKQETITWGNQSVVINGARYYSAVIKRQVIYPQKSGKFQVKPFEMECIVNRSFFSVGSKVNVVSNSPTIEVLPFPQPEPLGFGETTGKYKLESSISTSELKANEPVTLKIKISGEGNLKILGTLKPEFPSDFETYDPKINDRIKLGGSGLSGSREFEYLVIPRYPGEYTIPALNFSYFDVSTKAFKTLTVPAYNIKVNKGTGQGAGAYTPSSQNQVALLNKDIRFIHTDELTVNETSPYSPKSPLFWTIYSAIPLAFAGLALMTSRRKKRNRDKVKLKSTSANKVASKLLSEARKALQEKDDNRFYEATFKALYGYISDKLNIPYGDLNRSIISSTLLSHGVEQSMVTELLNTLDTCEMARFAPLSQSSPQQFYEQTSELINKLEKTLNR